MKNQIKSNFMKSILVFKRWNRKGYSVFNSLRKIVLKKLEEFNNDMRKIRRYSDVEKFGTKHEYDFSDRKSPLGACSGRVSHQNSAPHGRLFRQLPRVRCFR